MFFFFYLNNFLGLTQVSDILLVHQGSYGDSKFSYKGVGQNLTRQNLPCLPGSCPFDLGDLPWKVIN